MAGLVTGAWKRLVFGNSGGDQGVVDYRAYTFCVLEHLHRGLSRRDVFVKGSDRWGDPRARLLDGEAWEQAKGDVVTALQLTEQPDLHLAELAGQLDADYRAVAARLPENAALELINDGERISLERLDAEPAPPSLVELRRLVGACCPASTSPTRCSRCTRGPAASTGTRTSRRPGPVSRTCRSPWPRSWSPRPATSASGRWSSQACRH